MLMTDTTSQDFPQIDSPEQSSNNFTLSQSLPLPLPITSPSTNTLSSPNASFTPKASSTLNASSTPDALLNLTASLTQIAPSTPTTPSLSCCCKSKDKVEELESRVLFLQQSMRGLEEEVTELRQILFDNASICEELRRTHSALQKEGNKQTKAYQSELTLMEDKLKKLSEQTTKFKLAKARKPYHQLASAQQKRVRREVREIIAPELNNYFNERSLTCGRLVLDDVDGERESVQVHVTPHHKYSELTPIERQTVQRFSNSKSINFVSDESYAAFRRLNSEIPPLSHLKQYDRDIIDQLPALEDAPGRTGAFLPIQFALGQQMEYLVNKGDLAVGEEVAVKIGIDGTKLTNKDQLCVYTAATITKTASDIGVVGCVSGGDSSVDMDACAAPFFKNLKELALNPSIITSVGEFPARILCGGDMCNILAQYGLAAASSNHPCPVCIVPKTLFSKIFFQPDLLRDCNNGVFARTRGNILAEAAKSNRSFGVKRPPLSPLPLDLEAPLISVILYCSLHGVLRIVSK